MKKRVLGPFCSLSFFLNERNGDFWRHDIQHNDTQHNDIQHKDTQYEWLICDTQHNDIQHK